MQELCLKNCDQDAAGQKLENLSKGGMVWEQTVYRKGFLPCCMLAASAVKAPRLAIPLASSNELTRMSVQVGSSCEDNTTWHFLPTFMLAQL